MTKAILGAALIALLSTPALAFSGKPTPHYNAEQRAENDRQERIMLRAIREEQEGMTASRAAGEVNSQGAASASAWSTPPSTLKGITPEPTPPAIAPSANGIVGVLPASSVPVANR